MPNYKKRKSYQTGGATQPKSSSKSETLQQRMQRMQAARNKKPMQPKKISQAEMNAMQRASQQMQKDRGLRELGQRQRAAAARAKRGPTRAEAARNMAEYERAMRARQAARNRMPTLNARTMASTPQQRANYEQTVRNIQNRSRTRTVPTFDMRQARPVGQTLTPQQLERLRTNPNRPNMVNQVQNLSQAKAAERRRIQQQIAQLQARLRQLGG